MSVSTEWRHASLHACAISLEQPRMPMRCSGSSPGLMLCLYAHTSEVQFVSTRHSWFKEWRTTLRHFMTSLRYYIIFCSYPTMVQFFWFTYKVHVVIKRSLPRENAMRLWIVVTSGHLWSGHGMVLNDCQNYSNHVVALHLVIVGFLFERWWVITLPVIRNKQRY